LIPERSLGLGQLMLREGFIAAAISQSGVGLIELLGRDDALFLQRFWRAQNRLFACLSCDCTSDTPECAA